MKTTFTFFALFCFLLSTIVVSAQPCYINQPQTNAFANVTTATASGQTFKACGSGVVTNIRLNIGTLNTDKLKLQMASGNNTLSPEYTQDFNISSTGNINIPLNTPFSVEDGQTYAFTVIGITGDNTVATTSSFNGNPYPDGNAITETGGMVNNFATDVNFSLTIVNKACVLDQPETNAFANVSTTTASGQTFKACKSGVVTNIRINVNNLNTDELKLQMASGNNTLTPEYTQDFSVSVAGDVVIQLTTPFLVEEDQPYAFTVIGITGDNTVATTSSFNGNPYPDGNAITETGGTVNNFATDVNFSITIVEKACVLDQPETNAFANVSTATASGQTFKACKSGVVTNIRINVNNLNTDELKLQMASGNNTLTPEYTQDFSVSVAGNVNIQLTTPFPVEEDQTYAFTVIGITGDNTVATTSSFNGNPYPDGNAITETGGTVNNFATDVNFSITILQPFAPQNNLSCNAIDVPTDGTVQSGFTNVDADTSSGEEAIAPDPVSCATSWCAEELTATQTVQVHNSVWFTFVAPASGAVEISTCDLADFDSQLALYSATNCVDFTTYTLVAANDDGPASCATDFDSWMQVNDLVVGQTYYIMVDGYQGASGAFGISVTEVVSTSAEDIALENMKVNVFPNPNQGQFSLSLDGLDTAMEMTITTVTGQVVYRQNIQANETLVDVQLKDAAKGLYLMTLANDQRSLVRKVVID